MSSAVQMLKDKFGLCTETSCEVESCKLSLSEFPSENVILDIDCVDSKHIRGRICDFIIVVEQGGPAFLIVIEIKSTAVSVRGLDKIEEQLKGGMKFFERHCHNQFIPYPVLVSKRLKRPASKQLQEIVIRHKKKSARIRHKLCNQSLSWKEVKPG